MLITAASLAIIALGQSASGNAGRADEQQRLRACIAKLDEAPNEAYEDGLAWIGEGGRPLARQCTALALVELGHPSEGAFRLEELANAANGGSIGQRVVFLTQAGNAWILAGQPEAALVTLENALRLSPTDPNLNADRAAALIELERWSDAIADLDLAHNRLPKDISVLQMRAEALLNLDDLHAAREDIEVAMALAPENIDTLLLRGRIREAQRLQAKRGFDDTPIEILGAE